MLSSQSPRSLLPASIRKWTGCSSVRSDPGHGAAAAQKAGLVPTGILANVSRAAGYGSVSQLLTQVRPHAVGHRQPLAQLSV